MKGEKTRRRSYTIRCLDSIIGFGKSFHWSWINGPKNLQSQNKCTDIEWNNWTEKGIFHPSAIAPFQQPPHRGAKKEGIFTWKKLENQTWTCQRSGSCSLQIHKLGSSFGTDAVPFFKADTSGLCIQEMRSIFIKASSLQWVATFFSSPNSFHLVAFFQRCSKFIRTSYAAGPSTLLCRSCHGCLGALVPGYSQKTWGESTRT